MIIRVVRQLRELFLVIEDPRKLVRTLEMLSKFKIKARGIDIGMKHLQGVVLLDSGGYKYLINNDVYLEGYTINIDINGLEKSVATAIVYTRTLIANPLRRMIVGIDYGKNIGVAIVVNDDIVHTDSYRSPVEALKDIGFFVNNINSYLKIIRLGITNNIDENFVNTVINMFKDTVDIEFIPENRSSKYKYLIENAKLTDDEIAAINIALYRSKNDS